MITKGIVTDPREIAEGQIRRESLERNLAWFQEHASEIYRTHRGKCICIAGQQLFVADSPNEVLELARTAHPKDEGRFTHYVPPEKVDRIYAAQGALATL
jgi:hypothetical protein